ncbi:MAG TPA: phosphatase PAP2 family protein [Ferruginibacter sp.]|nr:phosphatase PAP2 family protein [Ferruginibacter sp.]HMP21926.1 phosphatase PAP2 family protein [Ferruginibacter sp.]
MLQYFKTAFKTFVVLVCLLPAVLQCRAQQAAWEDTIVLKEDIKKNWKQFIVPGTLITVGAAGAATNWGIDKTVKNMRNNCYPAFNSKLDDYLQFAPLPAVFMLDALGLPAANNWQQQCWLLFKAELMMVLLVDPVKRITGRQRPNGASNRSFPSGHTAQAFLAAHFFHKEFGKNYPWLSAGMYAVATTTGALRVLKNRHWLSDVMAGAGIGILCTELSYLTQRKNKKRDIAGMPLIFPAYQQGGFSCVALFKL